MLLTRSSPIRFTTMSNSIDSYSLRVFIYGIYNSIIANPNSVSVQSL